MGKERLSGIASDPLKEPSPGRERAQRITVDSRAFGKHPADLRRRMPRPTADSPGASLAGPARPRGAARTLTASPVVGHGPVLEAERSMRDGAGDATVRPHYAGMQRNGSP